LAIDRYPLAWPTGWQRTPAGRRQHAKFSRKDTRTDGQHSWTRSRELSVADAVGRLQRELARLGAQSGSEVLSTNLILRLDGLPRSDQANPPDSGAAVYFKLRGHPRVLACDRWVRVADNIAAIAAHIDAIRAVDRYGVGSLEQAFAGYTALPAQASPWWTVLEFADRPTAWAVVESRYSELAKRHHPDRGGSQETMAKINAARDAARIDLGVAA
jgi:hypothetical protein